MIIKLPFPAIRGITLGPVAFVWGNVDDALLTHEQKHIEQFKADPIGFYPKYLTEFARGLLSGSSWTEAYRNISYEKQARGEQ